VVLYQMLAGKPPFEGSTPVVLMHSHLNEEPPRPSERVHEIPKVLDELVRSLMAKTPADRPWDAAAVGQKLTELRDKVNRGAQVAMVWPSGEPAPGKKSRGAARSARGSASASASAVASQSAGATSRKKARKGTAATLAGKDPTGSGSSVF